MFFALNKNAERGFCPHLPSGLRDALVGVAQVRLEEIEILMPDPIRSDLDGDRNPFSVEGGRQLFAGGLEFADEFAAGFDILKIAESLGVGRTQVRCNVVSRAVNSAKTDEIILEGSFVRRIEILADVDSEHALEAAA